MSINPLVELTTSGQSIWYDGIERGLITSGELKRLIDEDELRGVTSNPTIFEKAIDSSDHYSDQLREQAERQNSASEIYEALVVRDIQMAADLLAPVFEKTDGADGFVSLARYISDLTTPIYYIVGPPAMVGALRNVLNDAGVNIRTEEFTG